MSKRKSSNAYLESSQRLLRNGVLFYHKLYIMFPMVSFNVFEILDVVDLRMGKRGRNALEYMNPKFCQNICKLNHRNAISLWD